jgi:eukaryotic-like serine/threonine-protein kinase
VALTAGIRLGQYEIIAKIGVGGMGEVWCATDTNLGRQVAIKILPDAFAHDPERLARFEREAKTLASLNHPNIAQIYGLEKTDSIRALVMELVEGPTLADRIGQGPIPIDEALPIAKQIAEALEAAHEQGIIHRDLKPANIKLRADGMVKVLDFGLAKALAPARASDLSQSPTISSPAMTRIGVIVGTAAYMSPEQGRGQSVDKRTDIWAFGCVLFELVTGRRAFGGDIVADTLAAVVRAEPDWSALPGATPQSIHRLLRRCLEKDRRRRLADIADARYDLEEAQALQPLSPGWAVVPRASIGLLVAATILGILVGALMMEVWRRSLPMPSDIPTTAQLLRVVIDLPSGASLPLARNRVIALSSDGRRLAYVGQSASDTMAYLHDMRESTFAAVPGTEGATSVFFSPDGRWLGFLTADKVKKVALDGGSPITLCNANLPRRASWTHDDTIYFDQNPGAAGYVSRVAAAGGDPVTVIPASEEGRRTFSQMLPDGRTALMSVSTRNISADYADVILVSVATGQSTLLIRSAYDAQYLASGYMIFARASNLLAVPFDASRSEVTGEPVLVASGASSRSMSGNEGIQAAVSESGLLAYVPGDDQAIGRLAWVDRRGASEFLPLSAAPYRALDLSPNDQRVAVHVADVTDFILVHDLVRRESRRLAASEGRGWPVWSPDSSKLAFAAWQSLARSSVRSRDVDRGDEMELLPASTGNVRPSAWSPTRSVLGLDLPRRGLGMALLTIGGGLDQIFDERFEHGEATFSPDGRWVAYRSNETGRGEIFVRPTVNVISSGGRQISNEGGAEPVWCPCGELFYRYGNRWMSVRIRTNPELKWDTPSLAFETDFIDTPGRSYDVSANGNRLLIVKHDTRDIVNRVNLVANWVELLRPTRGK